MKTNTTTARRRGTSAFTLIELLIVVMIVGILSAAALPLYLAQSHRARLLEAQAGLSAVRSLIPAYRTEHGYYPDNIEALALDFSENAFFDKDAFSLTVEGNNYLLKAEGKENSSAPRGDEVEGFVVQMNSQGMVRYHSGDELWNTDEGDWSMADTNG